MLWFWAACLMAAHSNSISVRQLQVRLHVSYKIAYMLLQKRRRAMADSGCEPMGDAAEFDQTELPFRIKSSLFDTTRARKILIIGAVEVVDRVTGEAPKRAIGAKYLNTRAGRLRLAATPDNSAASIQAFVRAIVVLGTALITDGHCS